MISMHFITPRLATGGDCGVGDELAANIGALVDAGITHVIDMRQEWTDEAAFATHAPGITYHWIPMDDAGQAEAAATWQRVWVAAGPAFEQPEAKVLVHCHMGINRGPSAAFAVMLGLGHDPVEALQMIRDARPIAAVAYWRDVLRWHDALTGYQGADDRRAACQGWTRQNRIDINHVIRGIRGSEGTRYSA
jgi:protein-tyrosine phosphatase